MEQPQPTPSRIRRILRWLVPPLVLVVVAWAVAHLWLTPERFRPELAAALGRAVDRPVRLAGPLEWTLWPRPGLLAEGVSLAGEASAADAPPLARTEALVFRVRWLPLLGGDLVPASATFRGLQVSLRRDGQGRPNWRRAARQDRSARVRPVSRSPAITADDSVPASAAGSPPVALRVSGGRLSYHNRATGYRAQVKDLALAARLHRHGDAWLAEGMELSGKAAQSTLPGGPLAVHLSGALAADPEGVRLADGRLRAAGVVLSGDAAVGPGKGRLDARLAVSEAQALGTRLAPLLPAGMGTAALAGGQGRLRAQWDEPAGVVSVPELRLRAGGLAVTFQGRGGWQGTGLSGRGHLDMAVAEPARLKRLLGEQAPAVPRRAWDGSRLSGDLVWQAGQLQLSAASGRLAGMDWQGEATLAPSGAGPVLDGRLRTDEVDPHQLARRLGRSLPEVRGADALRSARLETDFGITSGSLTLAPLALWLDGSHLRGEATYRWGEGPVARWDLSGDVLDLDRYRPVTAQVGTEPGPVVRLASARPVAVGAPLATSIPSWARRLDAAGRLRLNQLQVAGLKLREVEVALRGREGRFRAVPLRGRLAEGVVDGALDLDATRDRPHWTLDLRWSGVALGPLQRALLPKVRLRGVSRGSTTLEAVGWRPASEPRAWNGDGRLEVGSGAVLGADLAHRLRATLARLQGQDPPAAASEPTTGFDSLSARYYLDRGRLHVTDLTGRSAWLSADGRGQLDLVDQRLSAEVGLKVTASPPGEDNALLERLRGITVPLRIQGSLAQPRVGLDLAPLLRSERGAATIREWRRQKERLRQETDEQLKDLEKRLQRLLE